MIAEYTDNQFVQQVCDVVVQAGHMLLDAWGQRLSVTNKASGGIVTQVDLASEKLLIELLGRLVPEAVFWTEESGKLGNGRYCWVVDPLDGTRNFVHEIPYFCVSVAFMCDDAPIVAVTYDPVSDELFCAAKGQGAWCNGENISVVPECEPRSAVIVGMPHTGSNAFKLMMQALPQMRRYRYSFRYFGAAALELAYVACGRLDAVFSTQLPWWDAVAGVLLVQEAGGTVTDFTGLPVTFRSQSLICGTKSTYNQLYQLLNGMSG